MTESGGRSWRDEGQQLTLADGESVLLRHIRPDDEPLMVAFHGTLSQQSVYLRYFTPLELSRRIDHARLYRICHADGEHDVVLVALQGDETGQAAQIIAVGRLTRSAAPEEDASEFAIIVSDGQQRRGLGRALLARLIAVARAQGRSRVLGYLLPENQGMLHLCISLGFHASYVPAEGLIRATLELAQG
jgi:acetyltransferase